ncbi:GspH/FimT family pseudopilin [Thioalkalivibrio sp. HL-Eb18]|uniref:GspH/FimT family pseudopilin n=1 Tax=Thioalkalivibrio sp. HL-Eb18 TaxID=1266913 RepID=UPI00037B4598|nr:GspH/FimT family pseudopilin [Thioalkalivibrio sp. HL-Eb18]
MSCSRGFTLVELMVTLLVASILLGIGAPAFGNLVEQTRLTTTTNQFLTTLHMTRSEAIRRGSLVTLCTSADGATCTDTSWDAGWILFANPGRIDQPTGPDRILRVGNAWTGANVTVSGNQPVSQNISYNALGQSERLSGALLMGTVSICSTGDEGRAIIISSAGRPRVATADCT